MGFLKEFLDFLHEQKIITVALAFIVGLASVALVQALVKDIITPLYSPYLSWLNPATSVMIGNSNFFLGDFVLQLINWIVVLLVVFFISKMIISRG